MSVLGPVAVFGNGWAALASLLALAAYAKDQREVDSKFVLKVCWVRGANARFFPPLACMDRTAGSEYWLELWKKFGLKDDLEILPIHGIKEFRNKSFREPIWIREASLEKRWDILKEYFWLPEASWIPLEEVTLSTPLGSLEEKFRKLLESKNEYLILEQIEDMPLKDLVVTADGSLNLTLGSGDQRVVKTLLYADYWSRLTSVECLKQDRGLQKHLNSKEFCGAIQVVFNHAEPCAGIPEEQSFIIKLGGQGKQSGGSAGDSFEQKSLFGYCMEEGRKSVWSSVLTAEEALDNNEILKKIRKIKQTLSKVFGEGGVVFENEDVRFNAEMVIPIEREESWLTKGGSLPHASNKGPKDILHHTYQSSDYPGLFIFTDGFGPYRSYAQVRSWALQSGVALAEGPSVEKSENT